MYWYSFHFLITLFKGGYSEVLSVTGLAPNRTDTILSGDGRAQFGGFFHRSDLFLRWQVIYQKKYGSLDQKMILMSSHYFKTRELFLFCLNLPQNVFLSLYKQHNIYAPQPTPQYMIEEPKLRPHCVVYPRPNP